MRLRYPIQHAISVGSAVVVAVLLNAHVAYSKEGWLVLSAFLVSQTTRGTPIRQGLIYFLIMILGMMSSGMALLFIPQEWVLGMLAGLAYILCNYVAYIRRPLSSNTYFLFNLYPLIVMISLFLPTTSATPLYERLIDVLMGSLIGIICGYVIFPVRLDREFIQGVAPVFSALNRYSQSIVQWLQEDNSEDLYRNRVNVENTLISQEAMYPDWVYETGFNPGLRAGFRFFLINVERATDSYFSLQYQLSCVQDKALIQEIAIFLATVLQVNRELLTVLHDYFTQAILPAVESDYTSDMNEFEEALSLVVPSNIELLDINPDYIFLAAIARDVKELRRILLQLIVSLPAPP